MARFCKFFQGLCNSPSREVTILANLVARDIRSPTGSNLRLISGLTDRDPWTDGPAMMRTKLTEAEAVTVADMDGWRIQYLGVLLGQRQEWHYRGAEEEEKELQNLIDSLCVN